MYQFIVNPSAGAGRGYLIWKRLEKQLEKENREYRVYFTENQGDATVIARALTSEKTESRVLIVVGGEGTYNEVLNGASIHSKVTLGYLPVGFRNMISGGFQSSFAVKKQIRELLNPRYYNMPDYGVVTCGRQSDIFNRRFAAQCGVGLDAAVFHNMPGCTMKKKMCHFHMSRILFFIMGLKQLMAAKPVKGYLILDGHKKIEFNNLYFMSFCIRGENEKRKKGSDPEDDEKMNVFIGNSSRKSKMIPILLDVVAGMKKKEHGVRIFACNEASIHLERPLAVHVDGESCLSQQDLDIRCIGKKLKMIGSCKADMDHRKESHENRTRI